MKHNKKICFINTPTQFYSKEKLDNNIKYSTIPPLGLGYVATAASEIVGRNNVSFIDAEHLRLSPDEIAQKVMNKKIEFVGINITSPNYAIARKIISKIGAKTTKKIIVGGPHAILDPDSIFLDKEIGKYIYCVCTGDGEPTIKDILKGHQLPYVTNIKYRGENGEIISSKKTKDISLKELNKQRIDRSFFLNDPLVREDVIESYILSSRGCPFSCSFCSAHKLNSKPLKRSIHSLKRELIELRKKEVNYIRFVDDLFLTSEKMIFNIKEIFDDLKINKSNFGFEATARTNITSKFDDYTWKLLADMGMHEIEIGIESGSPRILKLMGKKTTNSEVIKTVSQAIKHGIKVKGFLMVGYPTEKKADLKATIQLIRQLKEIGEGNIRFSPVIAKAYPGTEIFRNYNDLIDDFSDDILINLTDFFPNQYSAAEEKLLQARTRYNAVHSSNGKPVVLSELTGGANLMEVLEALATLIIISDHQN
ncbi:MAG: B12-binding domain-containing radical SAM protein [Bacillota bacterium]